MYIAASHLALALVAAGAPALATPIRLPQSYTDNEPTHTYGFGESHRLFSQLLSLTDPKALHEALHNWHPKFTDGAFESDHSAAHAIHDESPALATAILELAKRQETGAPNTTNAAPTESSPGESTRIETVTPSPSVKTVIQQTTFTPTPQTSATQAQTVSQPQPVTTSVAPTPVTTQASVTTAPVTSQVVTTAPPTSVSVAVSTFTTVPQSSRAPPTTQTTQAPETAAGSTSLYVTTIPATDGGSASVYTSVVVVGVTGKNDQGAASTSPAGAAKSGSLIDAGSFVAPAPLMSGLFGAMALIVSSWVF